MSKLCRTVLFLHFVASPSEGCTYVEVPTPDQTDYVIGRTMELAEVPGISWATTLFPRGASYTTDVHHKDKRNSKYGVVAIQSTEFPVTPLLCDGMNEAGLSVSANSQLKAHYENPDPNQPKPTIWQLDVTRWLLSEFNTTDAAIQGLESVYVIQSMTPESLTGFHWAITDASGHSVVVEYMNGKRTVHKNDVRIMTNDPAYEWQVENLNNYESLSPTDVSSNNANIQVDTEIGTVPLAPNHGYNLFSLPGDPSPPSRFVRTFFLKQYAQLNEPPKTTEDAMALVTGLLNSVFIVKGTVAKAGVQPLENTNYAVLKLPKARQFYVRSYMDMQWRLVDLNKLSFKNEAAFPVETGKFGFKDVTALLEPQDLV